jgi:hypothetical protein
LGKRKDSGDQEEKVDDQAEDITEQKSQKKKKRMA